jgi:integrase
MSPAPRNPENKGLPARWRKKYQTYYYRVPTGQEAAWDGKTEFRLGKTLREAHETFASRLVADGDLKTISQLALRYETEVVPEKAAATQRSNRISLTFIRKVFESASIEAVTSKDIYKFRDIVSTQKSKKQANLALEVLSHMFTKAIEWGARERHPMTNKQVVKFSLKPRERYVSDFELTEAMKAAPPLLRAYIPIKLALGQRKADMLSIQFDDIDTNGLNITQYKTGKRIFFPFSNPETGHDTGLKPLIDAAITQCHPEYPKRRNPNNIFCTRDGKPYYDTEKSESSGFDSIWQRFIKKAMDTTMLEERFTEHDLRAKVGSDADGDENARQIMGHSNIGITKRVYRRKGEVVIPATVPNLL